MQESTFIEELLADRINEAHLQGQQEGFEKGARETICENILDILVTRFNPPVTQYRQIERQLDTIQDVGKCQVLKYVYRTSVL